jgi:acyl-CoA reductase-like NAD-dependent aldehyde dehydrogenase
MAAVNDFCKSNSRYPFGGHKDSGVGRECGAYGLKEFWPSAISRRSCVRPELISLLQQNKCASATVAS